MILWNSKCGRNETGIEAYELQIGGIDQGHFTVYIEFVVQFEKRLNTFGLSKNIQGIHF